MQRYRQVWAKRGLRPLRTDLPSSAILASVLVVCTSWVAEAQSPRINDQYQVISSDNLSPPSLSPINECATAVHVEGFIPKARIRVYANGTDIVAEDAPFFGYGDLRLTRALHLGEVITATQTVLGFESTPSPTQVVGNYPTTLGQPTVDPDLFACGRIANVGNLTESTEVDVRDMDTTPPNLSIGRAQATQSRLSVQTRPLVEAHRVSAQQSACLGDPARLKTSQWSAPQTVRPAPNPTPTPGIAAAYVGNDAVTLNGLLSGAGIAIKSNGINILNRSWLANAESNSFRLARPLQSGDSVTAAQELCTWSTDSPPNTPVASIPPPTVVPPLCGGEQAVLVRDTVINANVVLQASRWPSPTTIIGYGGAGPGDVLLRLGGGKQIQEGDQITAVQTIGNLASPVSAPVYVNCSPRNVITQHNDNRRTGWASRETVLTPAAVDSDKFGLLFTQKVDGRIYGQPLYVEGVRMSNGNQRNLVFVATSENSVYAFDAEDSTLTGPVWSRVLIGPNEFPVPVTNVGYSQRYGRYLDMKGNIGITGTPVIDPSSGIVYVVSKSYRPSDKVYVQRLHALDISTGATIRGTWPITISASVPGSNENGPTTIGFLPDSQHQRAALLLQRPPQGAAGNPVVFVSWGAHGDAPRYHGWLIGYDAKTGAQVGIFNTSPNINETKENGTDAGGASIWQAGQGPATDDTGNIYVMTGNGVYDPARGNFGSSILKLALGPPARPGTSMRGINLIDHFTPANWGHLTYWDADLGSAGPLIIPGTNTLVGGGKEAYVYSINTAAMGGLEAQEHTNGLWARGNHIGLRHIHGSPVAWNSSRDGWLVYVWPENDVLRGYRFDQSARRLLTGSVDGAFALGTIDTGCGALEVSCMPGGMLSISSDSLGADTGIVWASVPDGKDAVHDDAPGRLIAFAASPTSGRIRELWRSDMNPGYASAPSRQKSKSDYIFSKFSAPTVANGRVYVSTFSRQIRVYGLRPD